MARSSNSRIRIIVRSICIACDLSSVMAPPPSPGYCANGDMGSSSGVRLYPGRAESVDSPRGSAIGCARQRLGSRSPTKEEHRMRRMRGRALGLCLTCTLVAAVSLGTPLAAQTKPEGELKFALYVTISPQWFDPGETTGFITPFWFLYAMHDALVKNMPGKTSAPCLAESWTVSADQKVYDFKLRAGLTFHNGDAFTADDVRFSFYRAKGYKILKEKVRDVEVAGPHRVRFHLHEPWPDFMTFYGTLVSGAGWIVPKRYVEQVGDDGFKKHPVGLGPYKFVSHTPGVELVLEAFEGYWRKTPSVKRLVMKSVPESTTRVAMLKRGEIDIAYLLEVPQAEEVKRDPNLKLAFTGGVASFYIDFFDMWDPKSPWADQRVRLAASHAVDR